MTTELPIHYNSLQDIYAQTVGNGQRSLAIASAERGEGVTMLALALARRAASAKRRTLLVDLNLAHPEIHNHFDMARSDWTPDDEASWEAALQVDADSELTVLTAPPTSGNHWSFRDRTALAICLAQWHANFECVIVDTSALNRHNFHNIPSATVCGAMGATLLVVLAARTPENKLIEARHQLDVSGAQLIGTILNDRHLPGLAAELSRETHRLDRLLPRSMARLRERIKSSPLLNQWI